jgi:hypothetical protein
MIRRLAALAALALLAGGCEAKPAPHAAKRDLYLITPLPLLFGDGFGLDFAKPDVVGALEQHYALKPVDLPSQLPPGATLLMAQPRALPAEELVTLDRWVRSGGRVVLLADPLLEWPSARPLGDRLRPPVMFADTGLLRHWGMRLDAPDEQGPVTATAGRGIFVFLSPGTLAVGGGCRLEGEARIATCTIGKGKAVVVADADWIDTPRLTSIDDRAADGPARLLDLIRSLDTAPPAP